MIDGCIGQIDRAKFLARIVNFSPDIIIVNTSTPSVYNDVVFASELKATSPEMKVFVVGAHVSATVCDTFRFIAQFSPAIDGVIVGEYDAVVVDIADRMQRRHPWTDAPGLALKRGDDIQENAKPSMLRDLDDWPLATSLYREFLHIPAYYYGHSKCPIVTIITGRGCRYRCTFCQLPQVMHGHDYRTRSVDDVIREFAYIKDKLPFVRNIMIEDDTFTVDRARVRGICTALIEHRLTRIEWTCNARADVDAETLIMMRKAGCRAMCVGFESGDQEVLNRVRKGTKLTLVEQFARNARDAGIKVHGCFMFGNVGETKETMRRTLEFALRLPINTAQFFPIMPSPGTIDYDLLKSMGMIKTEDFSAWNDADGNHRTVVEHKYLSAEEIDGFCDFARRRFYLRPSFIAYKARESLSNFQELKRNLYGFRRLAKHLATRPGRH